MADSSDSIVAICTYRVKSGKEAEFQAALQRHWPTLRDLGLAADEPSQIFKGLDESGGAFFVEILTWKNADAPNHAHEIPEVMSVWEPMGRCCEARLGRPAMEFPVTQPLHFAAV
jgi:hypothetical protein